MSYESDPYLAPGGKPLDYPELKAHAEALVASFAGARSMNDYNVQGWIGRCEELEALVRTLTIQLRCMEAE